MLIQVYLNDGQNEAHIEGSINVNESIIIEIGDNAYEIEMTSHIHSNKITEAREIILNLHEDTAVSEIKEHLRHLEIIPSRLGYIVKVKNALEKILKRNIQTLDEFRVALRESTRKQIVSVASVKDRTIDFVCDLFNITLD